MDPIVLISGTLVFQEVLSGLGDIVPIKRSSTYRERHGYEAANVIRLDDELVINLTYVHYDDKYINIIAQGLRRENLLSYT